MTKLTPEIIKNELQKALEKGWKEFQTDERYKLYEDYSDELRVSGFFDSKFRKIIPHPGHDNAAKIIGKYFLETLIKLDINVDQFFPGDFDQSTETNTDEYQLRNFFLDVYYRGKLFCRIQISYPHAHAKFEFPAAPIVTIEKEY
jgi:hypothetical protein